LAGELRDSDFSQKFILSAVKEEALPIQLVLGKVIRAYGAAEFAKLAKMPKARVLRAIDRRRNPSQETLSRLLKPFGLTVTVAPIEGGRRAA
jgi:DNA-binding phage protein